MAKIGKNVLHKQYYHCSFYCSLICTGEIDQFSLRWPQVFAFFLPQQTLLLNFKIQMEMVWYISWYARNIHWSHPAWHLSFDHHHGKFDVLDSCQTSFLGSVPLKRICVGENGPRTVESNQKNILHMERQNVMDLFSHKWGRRVAFGRLMVISIKGNEMHLGQGRVICVTWSAKKPASNMAEYHRPDSRTVQELKDIANKLRIHSVKATQASNSGWVQLTSILGVLITLETI